MFPETYPEVLKNVSFNINENIGILNNWNKYCKTSKENQYFVYTVLKNSVNKTYFPDDQILPTSVLNLVKYISSCITVKWTEDEFVIKFKKIKDENGKFKGINVSYKSNQENESFYVFVSSSSPQMKETFKISNFIE